MRSQRTKDMAIISPFLRAKGLKNGDIAIVVSSEKAFEKALKSAKAWLNNRLKEEREARSKVRIIRPVVRDLDNTVCNSAYQKT